MRPFPTIQRDEDESVCVVKHTQEVLRSATVLEKMKPIFMETRWLVAFVLLSPLTESVNPENMWKQRDHNGDYLTTLGDPSPGLNQRTCYSYYGPEPTRAGKEWPQVACKAPFNQVCISIKGEAELEPYKFRMSYVRGCHFRCPCPDAQPWKEWYMAEKNGDPAYRLRAGVKRHWEKKCFMQHPPKGYAVASAALPFAMVSSLSYL